MSLPNHSGEFSCSVYGRCLISSINANISPMLINHLAEAMGNAIRPLDADGKPWASIVCVYRDNYLSPEVLAAFSNLVKKRAAKNLRVGSCVMSHEEPETLAKLLEIYRVGLDENMQVNMFNNLSDAVAWSNATLKELS